MLGHMILLSIVLCDWYGSLMLWVQRSVQVWLCFLWATAGSLGGNLLLVVLWYCTQQAMSLAQPFHELTLHQVVQLLTETQLMMLLYVQIHTRFVVTTVSGP